MDHAAENAPLFIESFYDACEDLRRIGRVVDSRCTVSEPTIHKQRIANETAPILQRMICGAIHL